MATRRYSVAPGDADAYGITEAVGAATATKSIELTVDLANVVEGNTRALQRQEVVTALEKLVDYVRQSNWPPA
jgi:hypothetical protein